MAGSDQPAPRDPRRPPVDAADLREFAVQTGEGDDEARLEEAANKLADHMVKENQKGSQS